MLQDPAAIPLTTPVDILTVALDVLLLVQFPPEGELERLTDFPVQTLVGPVIAVGKGLVVTVCMAVRGPPQPAAEAVIVEFPVHTAVYVTAPFVELIVFPAARELASSE